jgi:hypothetical protein
LSNARLPSVWSRQLHVIQYQRTTHSHLPNHGLSLAQGAMKASSHYMDCPFTGKTGYQRFNALRRPKGSPLESTYMYSVQVGQGLRKSSLPAISGESFILQSGTNLDNTIGRDSKRCASQMLGHKFTCSTTTTSTSRCPVCRYMITTCLS